MLPWEWALPSVAVAHWYLLPVPLVKLSLEIAYARAVLDQPHTIVIPA
jgi:hypothetical protein